MSTVLTDQRVTSQQALRNLVEYESSTIQRVVHSTLAAESAALSKSLDRQLYLRLVVETLLYGQPELKDRDWRVELRIPGILVTDAKSLYDNLQKEATNQGEKRAALEVVVARDSLDALGGVPRWLPHELNVVDCMTKMKGNRKPLVEFLKRATLKLRDEGEMLKEREEYREETGRANPRPRVKFG